MEKKLILIAIILFSLIPSSYALTDFAYNRLFEGMQLTGGLNDLDDVNITSPAGQQVILYNQSSGDWYNSYLNDSAHHVNASDYWITGDRGSLRNIAEIFSSWITNDLFVERTGDTMTGNLDMDNNNISNVGHLQVNGDGNFTGDLYVNDIFASNNSIFLGDTKLSGNGTSLVVDNGNITGDFLFGDGSAITNLNLTNVSIDAGQINATDFFGDNFFGGTFSGNLTNIGSIIFNITGCTGIADGTLCHDSDFDTLRYVTTSGQVLQMNQETTMPIKNTEGSTVPDGSIVYIDNAVGTNPTFKLARADFTNTSGLIGVLTQDCVNNQVCPGVFFGMINDVDTSSFTSGDHLYLSDTEAGNFTVTPPLFPSVPVWVGTAIRIHPTEGSIFVFPRLDSDNGITMHDLGLVGDFIQTDYKIRSLPGNDAINQNVFTIQMNGTSGIDIPHLVLQPGGAGQASAWVRSGIVVPEAVVCLNSTNRTDPNCFADEGNFTWQITEFNTNLNEGADWGITGELEVIKSVNIQENLTVVDTIFSNFIGSIVNRITKIWASALDVSGDINQTNGNATINIVYGNLNLGGNATIPPDILDVVTGVQDSGNITSVQNIDGNTLDISEVVGDPGFNVVFNFTDFSVPPRRIEYVGRYDGSPTHSVEIKIFNHTSGFYVDINNDSEDIPSSAENMFLSFPIAGNTSEFLNGGNVSLQLIHTVAGNINHDIFVDFISLTPSTQDLPNVGEFVQITNYTNSNSNGVNANDENGNMTIQIPGDYRIEVTSSFAGEADSFLECSVFKNGIEDISLRFLRKLNVGGDIAAASLSGISQNLEVNDNLNLRCSSQINNAFVTFANLDFYIQRIGE